MQECFDRVGIIINRALNVNSSLMLKSVGGDMHSRFSEQSFMLLVRKMEGGEA